MNVGGGMRNMDPLKLMEIIQNQVGDVKFASCWERCRDKGGESVCVWGGKTPKKLRKTCQVSSEL